MPHEQEGGRLLVLGDLQAHVFVLGDLQVISFNPIATLKNTYAYDLRVRLINQINGPVGPGLGLG